MNYTLTQNQISRTLKRWTTDIDNQFNDIKVCSEIMKALVNIIYTSLNATEIHMVVSDSLSIEMLIDGLHVNLSMIIGGNGHYLDLSYLGILIDFREDDQNGSVILNDSLNLRLRNSEMIHESSPALIEVLNTETHMHMIKLYHRFEDDPIYDSCIKMINLMGKVYDTLIGYRWGFDNAIPACRSVQIVDEVLKSYTIETEKRISILRKDYKKSRFILKRVINNNTNILERFFYKFHSFIIHFLSKDNLDEIIDEETISVTVGLPPHDLYSKNFEDRRFILFGYKENYIKIRFNDMTVEYHEGKDEQSPFMNILNKQLPRIISLMRKS